MQDREASEAFEEVLREVEAANGSWDAIFDFDDSVAKCVGNSTGCHAYPIARSRAPQLSAGIYRVNHAYREALAKCSPPSSAFTARSSLGLASVR